MTQKQTTTNMGNQPDTHKKERENSVLYSIVLLLKKVEEISKDPDNSYAFVTIFNTMNQVNYRDIIEIKRKVAWIICQMEYNIGYFSLPTLLDSKNKLEKSLEIFSHVSVKELNNNKAVCKNCSGRCVKHSELLSAFAKMYK